MASVLKLNRSLTHSSSPFRPSPSFITIFLAFQDRTLISDSPQPSEHSSFPSCTFSMTDPFPRSVLVPSLTHLLSFHTVSCGLIHQLFVKLKQKVQALIVSIPCGVLAPVSSRVGVIPPANFGAFSRCATTDLFQSASSFWSSEYSHVNRTSH